MRRGPAEPASRRGEVSSVEQAVVIGLCLAGVIVTMCSLCGLGSVAFSLPAVLLPGE
jgi:hypothetical protein